MHLRAEIRENEKLKKQEKHMMHKIHKQLPKEIKKLHQEDEEARAKREHETAARVTESRKKDIRNERYARQQEKE